MREKFVLVWREKQNIVTDGEPVDFLQPSRKAGNGVTVNEVKDSTDLILLSGFFDGSNELRLIRRDGSPIVRWPVRFSDHFPSPTHLWAPPQTDRNIDIHGAVVLPNGSVVFNYEYGGTVKLSRCGDTLWTLPHPTHHSIDIAETGGYWIPGREAFRDTDGLTPFKRRRKHSYVDDLVLRVSEEGEIVDRKSVTAILLDNGLEPLMTAGPKEAAFDYSELVHLNKIGELSNAMADAFPSLEKGDLVLSLRGRNLVLIVDPRLWQVKWYQVGPWLRQHDPEFNDDGTITVFNNNVYYYELRSGQRTNLETPRISNIVKVNPKTGETDVAYGEKRGEEFLTVLRGKHQPTSSGGFLLTEFEGGRAFEVNAQGQTIWEFINRYDSESVLEITEARVYPQSHFSVQSWACPDTESINSQGRD